MTTLEEEGVVVLDLFLPSDMIRVFLDRKGAGREERSVLNQRHNREVACV